MDTKDLYNIVRDPDKLRILTNVEILQGSYPCPLPGCSMCPQQFRTSFEQMHDFMIYVECLDKDQAQALIREHLSKIRSDQGFLQQALQMHGDAIMNRWKKKSRDKRVSLLKEVFPNIQKAKWHLIDYANGRHGWVEARHKEEIGLAPYISLDTLTMDPMKLLSLLHARTEFSIEQWFPFDLTETQQAWKEGIFGVKYNLSSVLMYGAQLGDVGSWSETEIHRCDSIGFPRAEIVLRAQRFVFSFLRGVVAHLTDNIPIPHFSQKWDELVADSFKKDIGQETWSTFSNRAFTAPLSFDPKRLVNLARARLHEAEDDLWLLQTDSAHIRQYFQSLKDGLPGGTSGTYPVYGWMTNHFPYMPLLRAVCWRYVWEECVHVKEQHRRFKHLIKPGRDLPDEYNNASGALMKLVVIQILCWNVFLSEVNCNRSCFENSFTKVVKIIPHSRALQIKANKSGEQLYRDDPLLWCLGCLTEYTDDPNSLEPATLFSFLEDLLAADARNGSGLRRLDNEHLTLISDLAAFHDILSGLKSCRPRGAPVSFAKAKEIGQSRLCWRICTPNSLLPRFPKDQLVNFRRHFVKLDTLSLPSGKKDSEWLARADGCLEVVARFWKLVKEAHRKNLEAMNVSKSDIEDLLQLLSFAEILDSDKDIPKVKALASDSEENSKGCQKGPQSLESGVAQGFGQLSILTHDNVKADVLKNHLKAKIKTRPEAKPIDNTAGTACLETAQDESSNQPRICVKAEYYHIFMKMFPDNSNEGNDSSLTDWRRFVAAMAAAGFNAAQSGGSAVEFSNEEGKIVFHKPHPVAKIGHVKLLGFGKRLNKWFKIDRETFECKE